MTPIYQYPSINTFGGAFSGAMSAIGGGLAEIEAAKKSKARLAAMSDELAARGLTSDAAIYRNLADTETPNFLQAAIQGKPTEHNDAKMVDHALNILQNDRALAVKAASERDATLNPNLAFLHQDLAVNNNKASDLRAENAKLQAIVGNPTAYDSDKVAYAQTTIQKNNEEIARLEAENKQTRSKADVLLNKSGSSGSSVQTKGSDRSYYSDNQNQGQPALPGEGTPTLSDRGTAVDGGPSLLPQVGDMQAPFSDPNGNDVQSSISHPNISFPPASQYGSINQSADIPMGKPVAFSAQDSPSAQQGYELAGPPNPLVTLRPQSPLDAAIQPKSTTPATTKSSVTDSGSVDPVVRSKESFAGKVTAYKEAGGKEDPTDLKGLADAWRRFKPPVQGSLIFPDVSAAAKYAEGFPNYNANIKPNNQGQTTMTLTHKTGTDIDSRIGAAYKNPGNGNVYYVDNKQLRVALPDGTVTVLNFEGQEQTGAELRKIVNSWDHFNPDNPMLFVPAMSRQDVQQAAKSPVATPGNPSNSGGSSALDAWRASLKSSKNPPP